MKRDTAARPAAPASTCIFSRLVDSSKTLGALLRSSSREMLASIRLARVRLPPEKLSRGTSAKLPATVKKTVVVNRALIASTTSMPSSSTRPNTVKPPSTLSSELLLPALINHSLLALLTCPPTLAMAMVPRVLEMLNSFTMLGSVTIRETVFCWSSMLSKPPWITKPSIDRCITTLS